MLEADRHAQQIFRSSRARPLDRRAMLDQALRAAEARGLREELEAAGERQRRSTIATSLHGEHSAKLFHLLARDRMRGVRLEARIVHCLDLGMTFEKSG